MDKQEIVSELNQISHGVGIDNIGHQAIQDLCVKLEANPVYTKEMHEAEELPPVGARYAVNGIFENYECLAHVDTNSNGKGVAFWDYANDTIDYHLIHRLHPIQTQEEKDIDRLKGILDGISTSKGLTNLGMAEELSKHVTLKESNVNEVLGQKCSKCGLPSSERYLLKKIDGNWLCGLCGRSFAQAMYNDG